MSFLPVAQGYISQDIILQGFSFSAAPPPSLLSDVLTQGYGSPINTMRQGYDAQAVPISTSFNQAAANLARTLIAERKGVDWTLDAQLLAQAIMCLVEANANNGTATIVGLLPRYPNVSLLNERIQPEAK